VEDQQPDTGDLTTDATEPAPDNDVEAPVDDESPAAEAGQEVPTDPAEPTSHDGAPAPEESVSPPREPRRAHRMPIGKARKAAFAPVEPAADDEPTVADEQPTEASAAAESDAASEGQPADETSDVDTEAETAESIGDEPTLVAHRPAGKRLKVAAVAAAALFVAAAAFAGAMVQPFVVERALVQTKLDVARTAANGITTLWTYTPEDMDALPQRSARFLGGAFQADYRKYVDAIAPTNKQAKVSNNTQVLGTAVESLSASDATALVYTNSTSTSPVTKNIPSMRYVSYRLTMERHDARWLITRMSTITSLDLTPQL
jgi:Mce-associated membrane protein